MQQPLLGQILPSRSASKTIFVNRDLFSNYYLGTLLAREVRKHYGEMGSRMPSSIRRRMLNLWDRITPTLGPSTLYGQTRQALLGPILSMLGYEELQDLKESEAEFSAIDMQALPPGYYLYRPHDTSASTQYSSPLPTMLPTTELDDATTVNFEDERPEVLAEDEAAFFKPEQAEQPTILLSLLSWGQDFDQVFPTARHRSETPGKIMERLLVAGPAQWGLLFNGQRIRLLKRSIIAGRQHYFEVDLEALCESEDDYYFDTFWMLLRAQSFVPGPDGASFLDIVEEQSRAHAMGVSTSLKNSVFRAVEVLMRTLVDHAQEQIKQTEGSESAQAQQRREIAEHALKHLKPLYDQSLVLLYRLLFVLYAESRDLLPVNNNVYRESYSFIPLRAELEQPDSSYQPDSYRLWESIQSLFRLIHAGCNTSLLVVPAYNGMLFAKERTHYLNAIRVPDNALAEILRDLTLTPPTKERSRERIDYSDLGVEQLGAVYEGLLEFEPRIANEAMVEVRYKSDRMIIPQREQRDYTVLRTIGAGEFYLGRGAGRKTSGSYYTPQALVDFLVRRTLDPLVQGCTAEEILELKVVDPAMGSGAFLVGACHYLAEAYARALKREADSTQLATPQQTAEASDIDIISVQEASEEKLSEEAIRPYRRLVAERCLYGVDLNAMAVELAKVSLWLTTLAGDRPLTFLDANLRWGNSLISAPLSYYINSGDEKSYAIDRIHPEVNRRLAKDLGDTSSVRKGKKVSERQLYGLLSEEDIQQTLQPLAGYRSLIATIPSDTIADVHKKASILSNQIEHDPERSRLKKICDLWVASWFWKQPVKKKKGDPGWAPALDGSVYWELIRYIKTDFTTLPNIDEYEAETQRIVEEVRPFHWEMEFPEIYFAEDGKPQEKPGFNAVLANPPWDLILPNSREFFAAYDPAYRELERVTADRRQKELLDGGDKIRQAWETYVHDLNGQVDYFGQSEVYQHQATEIDGKQTKAHGNTYKLFLERAYKILQPNGSCGMIVPSGLYSDQGCKGLRELFLLHTKINHLFSIENRQRIFPIDSRFKFVLFGFEKKPTANVFEAAFMLQELNVLSAPEHKTLHIPSQLIKRFSPDTLSIMEFRSQHDLDIVAKIYSDWPLLKNILNNHWTLTLKSEEFNMTHDRGIFKEEEIGWPLFEGKMIHQFNHLFSKPRYWIDPIQGRNELANREISRVENAIDKLALSKNIFREISSRQTRISDLMKSLGRGPLTLADIYVDSDAPRIAFRDIARNTDERTLIATIVPQKNFVGNTINYHSPWYFDAEKALYNIHNIKECYTAALSSGIMLYLCGIFNAFILDYILRFKISIHANIFYVYQLPIPRLAPDNQHCQAIAYRVAQLVCIGPEFDELRTEMLGSTNAHVAIDPLERQQVRNEIDALVAHLYGLNEEDLSHILYAPYTFPLVKREIKHGVIECFRRVESLLQ